MLNTYTIPQRTTPTEISANLAAGSTIINLDPTNTVQLSSQTGMAWGNGIPLPPLGNQQTQNDGPLYVLLDPAATGSVQLVVTDEFTSYDNPSAMASFIASSLIDAGLALDIANDIAASPLSINIATSINGQGVPIVQDSTTIINQGSITLGAGGYASGRQDLGNHQSIAIWFQPNTDVTGDVWNMVITWVSSTGQLVDSETVALFANADSIQSQAIMTKLQAKARYFTIAITGTHAAQNCSLLVHAYTGTCIKDTVKSAFFPALLYSSSNTIAAGGTFTTDVMPAAATVTLYLNTAAPVNAINVTVYARMPSSAQLNPILQYRNPATNNVGGSVTFPVPWGVGLQVAINNTDTNPRTPTLVLTDTSGI